MDRGDVVADLFRRLDGVDAPRDLGWVKRSARPWIWFRRAVASLSVVAVVGAGSFAYTSLTNLDETAPSREGFLPGATPGPDQTPPCELPRLRPTYLPWEQNDAGIAPTYTDHSDFAVHTRWDGPKRYDFMDLTAIIHGGITSDVAAPKLPDGTTGFLIETDSASYGPEPSPSEGVFLEWSLIWPLKSGGCKSLHMALHMDGLSKDEERVELLKVAESLIEY